MAYVNVTSGYKFEKGWRINAESDSKQWWRIEHAGKNQMVFYQYFFLVFEEFERY